MTYTDKNGNTYRHNSGEWQVLKPGLGWSSFSCPVDIELNDGTIIPAQVSQKDLPKFSEAEKSILISHARDLHLQMAAEAYAGHSEKWSKFCENGSGGAVYLAKTLIEVLKAKGVL